MTDLPAWPDSTGPLLGIEPSPGEGDSYASAQAGAGLLWGCRFLPKRTVTARGVTIGINTAASAETPIIAAIYAVTTGANLALVGNTDLAAGLLLAPAPPRTYLPLRSPTRLVPGTVYFAMVGFANPLPPAPLPALVGLSTGPRPLRATQDARQSGAAYFVPPLPQVPPPAAVAIPTNYGPYVFVSEETS